MPIVPKKQIGEVRNVPAPTVFQSSRGIETLASQAGTGLQSFGAGLQNVGNSLEKITTTEAVIDNERMAKELDVEYNKRRRNILYGDEKLPGYFSLQGSAAVDNSERVKEELKKAKEEISSTAKNDYVRRIFDKASSSKHDTDLDHIGAFVNKERTVAGLTASQARRKEAIDDAVLASTSPQVVNRSIAVISNEIDAEAKIKGWHPDVIKSEREKALTHMYAEMIKGALHRQDVEGAVALFKEHGGKMDAPVAAQVEEMLKKPKLISSAQKETDARFVGSTSTNRGEVIAKAETDLKDRPELRDEVVKRLKEKFTLKDELDKDKRRAIVGSWAKQVSQGEKTLDQLIISNPDEYALIAQDYYSLTAITNAQVLRDKRQLHPAVSDQKTSDMFSNMSDSDLVKTDITAFRGSLSQAEFNRVETRKRIALDKQKGREETSLHMNRFKAVMKEYNQEQFKFFNPKQSDAQKEIQKKIIQEGELFIQEKIDQGKAPTDIELRQVMETLMKPVSSGGLVETGINKLFGEAGTPSFLKTTLAEARVKYSKEELNRLRIDINDLPDKLKTDITGRFKTAGITPTDSLIEEYAGAVFTRNEERKNRLLQSKVKSDLSSVINIMREPELELKSALNQVPKEKLGTKEEEVPFDAGPPDKFNGVDRTVEGFEELPDKLGVAEKDETPFDAGEAPVEKLGTKEEEIPFAEDEPVIKEAAKKGNLLQKIVKAKMQVESSGGLDKRDSKKGAIGPMQIMPDTAKNPGLGLDPIDPETLRDEKVNIEFGTKYLEALLKRYKGDINKAVAAYNMGYTALDKLIAEHGNDYWAQMPRETREHVAKFRRAFVNTKDE